MTSSVPRTHLQSGDFAPDFSLPSTRGRCVTLSHFRGRSTVVLAFYAAAFDEQCTAFLRALQQGLSDLAGTNTEVFGVSTDNLPSQQAFAAECNITFPMLSDFGTREVSEYYGVGAADDKTTHTTILVIAKDGRIHSIEEGCPEAAVAGAIDACHRLSTKH